MGLPDSTDVVLGYYVQLLAAVGRFISAAEAVAADFERFQPEVDVLAKKADSLNKPAFVFAVAGAVGTAISWIISLLLAGTSLIDNLKTYSLQFTAVFQIPIIVSAFLLIEQKSSA